MNVPNVDITSNMPLLILLGLITLGFLLWRFFLRNGTTDRIMDTSPRRKTARDLLGQMKDSKQQQKLEKENTNLNEY